MTKGMFKLVVGLTLALTSDSAWAGSGLIGSAGSGEVEQFLGTYRAKRCEEFPKGAIVRITKEDQGLTRFTNSEPVAPILKVDSSLFPAKTYSGEFLPFARRYTVIMFQKDHSEGWYQASTTIAQGKLRTEIIEENRVIRLIELETLSPNDVAFNAFLGSSWKGIGSTWPGFADMFKSNCFLVRISEAEYKKLESSIGFIAHRELD